MTITKDVLSSGTENAGLPQRKRIAFQLDGAMAEKLSQAAWDEGRTVPQQVANVVKRWLKERE